MCKRAFAGRVFSGLGEGGFYVGIYARSFRETLGITPYPGTLNVRMEREEGEALESCLLQLQALIVKPPPIPGQRLATVRVFAIELVGAPDLPAYIVRPDITVYDRSVVEIVSPMFLRERLGLSDGDLLVFKLRHG